MNDISVLLEQWHVDVREVREYVYRAPTPRERERWHALWLLARGWSAVQAAEALERDPHTIGDWAGVPDGERRDPGATSGIVRGFGSALSQDCADRLEFGMIKLGRQADG